MKRSSNRSKTMVKIRSRRCWLTRLCPSKGLWLRRGPLTLLLNKSRAIFTRSLRWSPVKSCPSQVLSVVTQALFGQNPLCIGRRSKTQPRRRPIQSRLWQPLQMKTSTFWSLKLLMPSTMRWKTQESWPTLKTRTQPFTRWLTATLRLNRCASQCSGTAWIQSLRHKRVEALGQTQRHFCGIIIHFLTLFPVKA